MPRMLFAAGCVVLLIAAITSADAQKKPGGERTRGEPVPPQKQILGLWRGGACDGEFEFRGDGTFDLTGFTPGQNHLTGIWSIRVDAVPPTLLLTYKTSDFKKKDPTREEWHLLGKTQEVKLLELTAETMSLQPAGERGKTRYDRPEKK